MSSSLPRRDFGALRKWQSEVEVSQTHRSQPGQGVAKGDRIEQMNVGRFVLIV